VDVLETMDDALWCMHNACTVLSLL